MAICQLCSIQEVKYNPKTAKLYKGVQPPKKAIVKKDVKSRLATRNGCDGRLLAKILITTIQANLCCLLYISLGFSTKFT